MIQTRFGLATSAIVTSSLLIVVSIISPGIARAQGDSAVGPDVVVFEDMGTYRWGTSGDTVAYSVGTESCNRGDEPVLWISDSNQHPVIAQNLYRLKDGRLEQIGLSWLKHGFVSVNGDSCGDCEDPPMGGSQLGVGCSDPYSAHLNGSQWNLGPRHEVNAFTGVFDYPHSVPSGDPILAGRIQVGIEDVAPAMNPGALYFIEGQYIAADDAAAGNDLNNASYRQVSVNTSLDLDVLGPTEESFPAVYAWELNDPAATVVTADVPLEGRFHVAYKAIDNGNGTWRYEYGVHNLNSHASAGSLSVPIPTDAVVTNSGFHDVDYHSGEPWDDADWSVTVDTALGVVTWSTDDYGTNPDANALRWGTMYNFWFDADSAPELVDATIGLFRPGGAASVQVEVLSPGNLGLVFEDGFESGDFGEWASIEP